MICRTHLGHGAGGFRCVALRVRDSPKGHVALTGASRPLDLTRHYGKQTKAGCQVISWIAGAQVLKPRVRVAGRALTGAGNPGESAARGAEMPQRFGLFAGQA